MAIFSQSDFFPLIASSIHELWNEHNEWVKREQILNRLALDPSVQQNLQSSDLPEGRDFRWYIGNAIDWFSQKYTVGDLIYQLEFERKKIGKKWAYKPSGQRIKRSSTPLGGQQVRTIQQALINAYPSLSALKMMVRIELGKNLDVIAGGENLASLCFNLVEWADSRGQIEALIRGAINGNPDNQIVQQLEEEFANWLSAGDTTYDLSSNLKEVDVFISYADADVKFMSQIQSDLQSAGFSVLTDEHLGKGDEVWQDFSTKAMRSSRCVVVLLSPAAKESTWVNFEISNAIRSSQIVIPVLVEGNINDSIPMRLTSSQFLDLRQDYETGFKDRLVPALKSRLGVTVAAIQDYSETRGGSQPLNEAKLVILGDGEVGKTSIVRRLVSDSFNDKEPATEGINVSEWFIDIPQYDNQKVKLHIWDFGGQEILHATHQFFLTDDSLYLLVLNGRQGREDDIAEYWLSFIQNFGGNSPVIVVLNRIAEYSFSVNERNLTEKYSNITFVKTDCKERRGIDELKNKIIGKTDELKSLRASLPVKWFEIKDRLTKLTNNFLSYEKYQEICEEFGESDPQAQDALIGHLHRLGVVLNYKNDVRLQDMHVLNPEWVTKGIYKIIYAVRKMGTNGEICLSDLSDILDFQMHPPNRHYFLLDLMNKFDLCFRLEEDYFIIPELLENLQPREADTFAIENCLNFQYQYDVFPEGILPTFIVRTYIMQYLRHLRKGRGVFERMNRPQGGDVFEKVVQ